MTAFDADAYAAHLSEDRGFERVCEQARHHLSLRALARFRPRSILEIGCGEDLLFDRALEAQIPFERWIVVEPSKAFADRCRSRARKDARLEVIEGVGEDLPKQSTAMGVISLDMALVSAVLHHAADPSVLLRAVVTCIRPGGRVVATVPNALSFHRLLAVEMGLAASPYDPGERALRLHKVTVFDPDRLRALLETCGVGELEFEGYLFKPFTHEQMASLLTTMPATAASGLDSLGRLFPRNAAEIGYLGVKI